MPARSRRGILERLKTDVVIGAEGYVFELERRGYIKAGAITPGIIVLLVGIIEALLLAGRTPNNFVPFMLSLWLPGIGLCVLGLLYVVASIRD